MGPLDQARVLWMIRSEVGTPSFNNVAAAVATECAFRASR
jgi:hypothetical protein